MKTIRCMMNHEIVIKNSKFICYLYPLDDDNIFEYLNEIKEMHSKATHICYAYIYDEMKYSTDDGEPSGTAGLPMLNVLEKENLNHILCFVVRYFGGIKLGAGGLVRAYTNCVVETLKASTFVELVPGYLIQITFSYEDEKDINYLLRNSYIEHKEYKEKITYQVLLSIDEYSLIERYSPTIIKKCTIKK